MSNPAIDLNQNPVDGKSQGFNRFDNRYRRNYRIIGHRILTVTSLLCLLILVIYIIFHKHQEINEVCLTSGCIDAASTIIKNLDTRVDPCDDFYQFACGGWINRTILPHGKNRIGTLNRIQETVYNKLRVDINRLAENIRKFRKSSHEMKLVNIYKTCINVDAIEARGNQPLINIINSLGGWLNLDNTIGNYFQQTDLADLLLTLKQFGANFNFLIAIDVGPDLKNTSNNIIAIDQAELALKHRSLYLQDAYVVSYTSFVMAAAMRLGYSIVPNIQLDIDAITKFEKYLAEIMTAPEMRRDYSKVYNKMTLNDLQNLAPNINWFRLLSALVKRNLTPTEEIVVFDVNYIKQLNADIPRLDPKILQNYVVWRVIYEMMPYLTKEWRDAYNIFHDGQKSDKPRWEECLDYMMDQGMDVALSNLYVKNHCDPETKKMATMAFQYIKNEFIGILEGIDWMGEETKRMALKKVKSMDAYIAYPEQILNHSLIDQFYEDLTTDPIDFAYNIRLLKKWNKDRDLNQYGHQISEIWWKQSQPAVVNAFYNPLENKIQLPAALLQGVFFDKDRPYYLNFASFGFLIGHEITHGFDERGKQFDETGNLQDWWDNETDSKFRRKIQCMIEQYDGYTVKELNMTLSGDLSKGENMADNGGLKLALKAYESWSKGRSKEPPLPGLSFTPDKLFWIGAANFWCEKQSRSALQNQILRDEHSPGKFRVIGPMSNLPEFSETFNCQPGSPMNPIRKCSVW